MANALTDFYRFPESLLSLPTLRVERLLGNRSRDLESARFSPSHLYVGDETADNQISLSSLLDYFRRERYTSSAIPWHRRLVETESARRLYYLCRDSLSDDTRVSLQRIFFSNWRSIKFPRWPVDTTVEDILEQSLAESMELAGLTSVPFIWFWPDGASSAAMVTHDVEAQAGLDFVPELLDIDRAAGIRASFQLVPEGRYDVSQALVDFLVERGAEVNIHGLNHDGNLFRSRKVFLEHASAINRYVRKFELKGFRSPCMYRNQDWLAELDVSYDMSVPNVAHFEPQRGGCCTVFPYFAGGILELPLTMIQDYSLFNILGSFSLDLWQQQVRLIMARHGLISLIAHPDYLISEAPQGTYKSLLAYLADLRTDQQVWIALPSEIDQWWRQRSGMRLVRSGGTWQIEGSGRERARIAFAHRDGDKLVYRLGNATEQECPVAQAGQALVPPSIAHQ